MFALLGLDHLSNDALLVLAIGIAIGGILLGFVADAVMGPRGFGPSGNGILVVLGAVVGVTVRDTWFERLDGGGLALTAAFCGCCAVALLLALGLAKGWVEA